MTFTFEPVVITFSAVAFLVGIGYLLRYFTKKYVDHYFNKNIEHHKHELQNIMEYNKFDLQRKFQDFSLFTSKKHEKYETIFNIFLTAEGKVRGMMGLRTIPDFQNMNSKQLEYFCKKHDISEVMCEKYINSWDERDKGLCEDFKKFFTNHEIVTARGAWIDAKNRYLLSRLYLSEKVEKICDELSKAIGSYILDVESVYDKDFPASERKRLRERMKESERLMDENIYKLKKKMQEELGIGYY